MQLFCSDRNSALQGLERRERRRPLRKEKLEDLLWPAKTLQAMLAEVEEAHAIRQRGAHEVRGCQGEEDLTPMPSCANPRTADDVEADIALGGARRLAGVEPHPHADGRVFRPGMRGERPLGLDGSLECLSCSFEGDKKGVALCIDLAAIIGDESGAQQGPVLCLQRGVAITEPMEQER